MDISVLALMFFAFSVMYGLIVYTTSLLFGQQSAVKRDYNYNPTVSVILSCFNEGDAVYKTIKSLKESNYPQDLLEIVAFDDCSRDDSWEWMQKAAADFGGVIIRRNAANKGKAPTLADAAHIAQGAITISTDADTIFDPMAIRELVACFADERIGSVGGIIGIANPNDSLLTQMQATFYVMSFWLAKPMENITKNVQCLGGPLVAFRRDLYIDILPEVLNRNFLGEPIHNGEDRFITQRVLLRGYKTFTSLNARCWVGTPVTWGNYLKQQLRWRRSAVGQWMNTVTNLPTFIRKAGVLATMGSLLPFTANFVWVLYLLYLCSIGVVLQVVVSLLVIKLLLMPMFGVLYNAFMKKRDPGQVLKNPILSSWMIPVWYVISFTILTPWALFTLDDGGWVTRQNGAKGNA